MRATHILALVSGVALTAIFFADAAASGTAPSPAPSPSPTIAPRAISPTPAPLPLPTMTTAPKPTIAGTIVIPQGATVKTTCARSAVHVSVCSGDQCSEALTAACAPMGCNKEKTWCATSCVSSADCAAGHSCNTLNGACAWAPYQCADGFTIITGAGQNVSCAPYKCLNGRCQQQCVSDSDCSTGYRCADHVACVKK